MSNPLRSIAGRITLLVFMATVVSSLTLSPISVQSLNGSLRQKVDQRFPQVASRISHEIDQWYTLRAREIEVFAGSAILTESTPHLSTKGRRGHLARNEAELYLGYVLEGFPQFQRLILATPAGETLVEVGSGEPLPEGTPARTAPQAEHTRISATHRVADRLIQIASVPMRSGDGKTVSRLYAIIDVDLLNTMLRSEELGETAMVFLVDRDQNFINPPNGVDPDATYTADGGEVDQASIVAYYDNPLGMRVVGTRRPFPRFGWTLVIEQPYDEAFAPIVSSMSRVAGLNIAIVLIVGLVALRIAASIVRPLHSLAQAAKRLSRGEREVEIDDTVFSSDEVKLLTGTFNEMSRGLGPNARELEENQHEIEAANVELVAKNQELSNLNLVLEQLSITDGLTKLHNHRYFQDSIKDECKRSVRTKDPLCLILIDIDFFKKWNHRLGHAGGDEILRRMAEVLNQSVRETDLRARYGGEEFALLAINTNLPGAAALGEKVRQAIEEINFMVDVPSEREQLTVSVGVAQISGDRKRLFADADSALYSAKDSGRNQVVIAPPTTDGSQIAEGDRVQID